LVKGGEVKLQRERERERERANDTTTTTEVRDPNSPQSKGSPECNEEQFWVVNAEIDCDSKDREI
jgi:hypothetical protein